MIHDSKSDKMPEPSVLRVYWRHAVPIIFSPYTKDMTCHGTIKLEYSDRNCWRDHDSNTCQVVFKVALIISLCVECQTAKGMRVRQFVYGYWGGYRDIVTKGVLASQRILSVSRCPISLQRPDSLSSVVSIKPCEEHTKIQKKNHHLPAFQLRREEKQATRFFNPPFSKLHPLSA
jgi:hypothetical protein